MRRNWILGLSLAGVAAASSLVVLLGSRIVELSKAYSELRIKSTQPQPGYVVPTIRARALAGDSIVIGELADTLGRQVVLVFTTTCPYCKATLPVWKRLYDSVSRVPGGRVQLVAISLDSASLTSDYATEHALQYPIVFFPDWKTWRYFRARSVPLTMVLNHFGEVIYSHIGLLEAGPGLDSLFRSLIPPAVLPRAVGAR